MRLSTVPTGEVDSNITVLPDLNQGIMLSVAETT
jgi:hypothetical protein